MCKWTKVYFAVLFGSTLIATPHAAAGHKKSCDECGSKKMKKVPCLVRAMEPVKIPVYECACRDVFLPKKGQVCTTQYRCDKFVKLHKHCKSEDCGCTEACTCKTWSTSKTKSGCMKLRGASPCGCKGPCTVKVPTGDVCTKMVPVVKWVMVPVCSKCNSCCLNDEHSQRTRHRLSRHLVSEPAAE